MFHQKSSLRVFTAVVFCLFQTHVCRGQPHSFGTPQQIVAALGDDVMLPCHLEPAQDAEGFTLEWTRPDLKPRFVHVWRSGVELQDKQHPHYRGRTALFIDELKHGNISLKLVKVKPADEGTYRCYIPSVDQQSFVQVLVAAASSPIVKLAGIHKPSGSVVLECTSSGWYPEPEVSWMDAEGHLVPAGPPETVRGPDDLYTVSSRMTVDQSHGSTVTCRVHQDRTNQTREAQIRVPDDFFMVQSDSAPIITALSVGLAICIMVIIGLILLTGLLWNKSVNKKKSNGSIQKETKGREEAEGEQERMIGAKTENTTRPDEPESGETTVTVDEVNPMGRSIRLKNNSKKDVDLLGWKLTVRVEPREAITYTFDRSLVLGPGKYAKLWAPSFGSIHDPSYRLWEELRPWNISDRVDHSLCPPTG